MRPCIFQPRNFTGWGSEGVNGCHRRSQPEAGGSLRAVRFSTFPQSGKSISECYWGLNLPAFVVAGLGLGLGWGGVGVGAWAKTG